MAARGRVRVSVGWGGVVVFALVGVVAVALVAGTGGRGEGAEWNGALSPLATPVPSVTATAGWWGAVEAELSVLATPSLTATVTVE